MRDPFPYESNVGSIRDLLVPDPVPDENWDKIIEDWHSYENPLSLLEYLALRRFEENELLEIMGNCLGVRVLNKAGFLRDEELDPTGQMLQSNGFRILDSTESVKLVTGGPVLNPDLSKYPRWACSKRLCRAPLPLFSRQLWRQLRMLKLLGLSNRIRPKQLRQGPLG